MESLESNKLSLEETYFDNPAEELQVFSKQVISPLRRTRKIPIDATLLCPDDKILAPY